MSRGVLGVFGQVSRESFDSMKSFSNTHHLPFITWSNLIESSDSPEVFYDKEAYLESLKQTEVTESGVGEEDINKRNMNPTSDSPANFQLFLQPDLGPTLIYLIKQNRWKTVYYIYNTDIGTARRSTSVLCFAISLSFSALSRINAILNYQTQENEFLTDIIIRKVQNISNCMEMLR
jgi:Receptor family ligand binding region